MKQQNAQLVDACIHGVEDMAHAKQALLSLTLRTVVLRRQLERAKRAAPSAQASAEAARRVAQEEERGALQASTEKEVLFKFTTEKEAERQADKAEVAELKADRRRFHQLQEVHAALQREHRSLKADSAELRRLLASSEGRDEP